MLAKASVIQSSITFSKNANGRLVGEHVNGIVAFDSQQVPTAFTYLRSTFIYGNLAGSALNFQDFFPADWSGDGLTDLIVRNTNGSLFYYQTKTVDARPQFTGGINVGNGFQFANYFVGDFTGDGIPDLIGRAGDGTLRLYPFNTTFIGQGGGQIIGNNFNYTDFFVADWSGDGITDLIVRNSSGSLFYFIFDRFQRRFTGGSNVGNRFFFTNYFIGDFNGDNIPDLLGRISSGDLLVYPFNTTFIGQGGGRRVGISFNFTDYFLGDWYNNDGITDLIVRNSAGDLILYPYFNNVFNPGSSRISTGPFGSGYLFNYNRFIAGRFGTWPAS